MKVVINEVVNELDNFTSTNGFFCLGRGLNVAIQSNVEACFSKFDTISRKGILATPNDTETN